MAVRKKPLVNPTILDEPLPVYPIDTTAGLMLNILCANFEITRRRFGIVAPPESFQVPRSDEEQITDEKLNELFTQEEQEYWREFCYNLRLSDRAERARNYRRAADHLDRASENMLKGMKSWGKTKIVAEMMEGSAQDLRETIPCVEADCTEQTASSHTSA